MNIIYSLYTTAAPVSVHSSSRVNISPLPMLYAWGRNKKTSFSSKTLKSRETSINRGYEHQTKCTVRCHFTARRCKGSSINVIYYWTRLDSSSYRTKPKKLTQSQMVTKNILIYSAETCYINNIIFFSSTWLLKYLLMIKLDVSENWCFEKLTFFSTYIIQL